MRSLLVVGPVCADPVDHHQDQSAISHIQPIAPSNKLVGSISCKRAIRVGAKIWFVKAGHDKASRAVRCECFTNSRPKYTRSHPVKKLADGRHQHADGDGQDVAPPLRRIGKLRLQARQSRLGGRRDSFSGRRHFMLFIQTRSCTECWRCKVSSTPPRPQPSCHLPPMPRRKCRLQSRQ